MKIQKLLGLELSNEEVREAISRYLLNRKHAALAVNNYEKADKIQEILSILSTHYWEWEVEGNHIVLLVDGIAWEEEIK